MAVKDDFSVGDIFSLVMGVTPVLLEDSRWDFFLFQIPSLINTTGCMHSYAHVSR